MRTQCQEEDGDLASLTSVLGEKIYLRAKKSKIYYPLLYPLLWMWVAGTGNSTVDGNCMVFNENGTLPRFDNCNEMLKLDSRKTTYSICERRIKEIPCESQRDCDGNATCSQNQMIQFGEESNIANKTCTCNFGFYGNGKVCMEVY